MKVIIQIPCYNEEATLPATLADIPRRIDGVDEVRVLVADDGSTDRTVEVARAAGADYILTHRSNVGLARNFMDAINTALYLGADIIVNTDGDNQYRGDHIPRLIAPILSGEADMVVGARDIKGHEEFSPLKKRLQLLGSWVVRKISRTSIPDTTSGFRAFHRDLALQLHVINRFSYTLETLIQAGNSDMKVSWVSIGVNRKTRDSRLFKSMPQFIQRQVGTMLRMFAFYAPMRFFLTVALGCFFLSFLAALRVIYHAYLTPPELHTVKFLTLSFSGMFALLGFFSVTLGVINSHLAGVRELLTRLSARLKHQALLRGEAPQVHIIVCNDDAQASLLRQNPGGGVSTEP